MLVAGQVIDERYEIRKLLGRGGMSIVYEAWHLAMNRPVAVKVLNDTTGDAEAMYRLRREAQAGAKLNHPNIVEVFGFGVWENQPYIAMELMTGESLASMLARETRLPSAVALPIFTQICDALSHAHTHGVVHRDIKPSNVMLLKEAASANSGYHVKLLDFGIAKLLPQSGSEIQKLTQTGALVGTILYLSPEQCLGKPVDARSDIYSLGCLMYETLDGKAPMVAETAFETLSNHIGIPVPDSEYISNAPYGSTVLWCLDKDPEKRPADVDVLKQALLTPGQFAPHSTSSAQAVKRSPIRPILVAIVALLTIGGVALAPQLVPAPKFGPESLTNFRDALQMGEQYLQHEEYAKSLPYFQRAEKLWKPEDSKLALLTAQFGLVRALDDEGRLAEAQGYAEKLVSDPDYKALSTNKREDVAEHLAAIYERTNQYDKAITLRERVILPLSEENTQGRSAWPKLVLAEDYMRFRKWQPALPLLKHVRRIALPMHVDLYLCSTIDMGQMYLCMSAESSDSAKAKAYRKLGLELLDEAADAEPGQKEDELIEKAKLAKKKYSDEKWYQKEDRAQWLDLPGMKF